MYALVDLGVLNFERDILVVLTCITSIKVNCKTIKQNSVNAHSSHAITLVEMFLPWFVLHMLFIIFDIYIYI